MSGFRLFENAVQAELYKKFRPQYPKKTFETIVDFLSKKDVKPFHLAIDIGCGSGQSTRPLAPHFEKVIGFDISEAQLENAREGENAANIEYRVGGGENITLPDNSTNLIACAQSVHWFDFAQFCKEADRVLKPSGCIALYGYGLPVISIPDKVKADKLNAELVDRKGVTFFRSGAIATGCFEQFTFSLGELYTGTLDEYWSERRKHIDNHYANFTIPYPETTRVDNLEIKQDLTLSGYIGYLKTWSAYWTYLDKNPALPIDPLDEMQSRMMKILGAEETPDKVPLTVIAPVFMLLGRKPV